MAQARARTAAGTNAVAFQLALPANHTCESLRFGDARVIGSVVSHEDIAVGRRTFLLMMDASARRGIVV